MSSRTVQYPALALGPRQIGRPAQVEGKRPREANPGVHGGTLVGYKKPPSNADGTSSEGNVALYLSIGNVSSACVVVEANAVVTIYEES